MKRYLVYVMLLFVCLLNADNYTLEDLIESGLHRASEIIKSNYNLSDSKADLYSSYLSFLPSAGASYYQNQIKDYGWNSKSAGFSMGFTMDLNESRIFNIKQSGITYKQAQLNKKQAEKLFAYSVLDKYTKVLETQTNLEISRQNLELQQKILEQTSIMYENGQKSLLDMKQSQLNLIDYEIQVRRHENNLSNLRVALFSYLNVNDSGKDLEGVDLDLTGEIEFVNETISIKNYKYNLESRRISRFQNLMDFLPLASAGWGYNRTKPDSISLYDFDNYSESYNFNINLSIDFLDYPDKCLNYGMQKRVLKRAFLDLNDAERTLKNSYKSYTNSLNTLETTFQLYELKKKLAGENLSMAQEQYSMGIIGLIDLDRFKIEFQNAQVSYNSSYYELIRARENLNLLLSHKILGKW